MEKLPSLKIKGFEIPVPIIQGGMGVGVSLSPLASAVAREGGVGIISSAGLDKLISKRTGKKLDTYEAVYEEISRSKDYGGFVGINIMVALQKDYENSVRGAIDAGANLIICGAGLPLGLPGIQDPKETALIPIVSSSRALEIICKKWERFGYRPDAVILEGPLAGGHLGFKHDEIWKEESKLENLLLSVKDFATKHGNFPVIVAGGIFSYMDIIRFLNLGADGVQMGTRFLATEESSATNSYKRAVVDAKKEDILVAEKPGSPCGLPFRVLRKSPMFVSALHNPRKPRCSKGYLLRKDKEGNFTLCDAKESNENSFCVCNGLFSSAGYNPGEEEELYTVGSNAFRVDKILSVKDLMDELKGKC
jgi:nitronate monooxygenase